MGVMLYLLDTHRRVRAAIVSGVSECIHSEASYTLTAAIPLRYGAIPGEYVGLMCVDGKFRLFEIDDANDEETEGTTTLTCTDAAVGELIGAIVHRAKAEGARAGTAAQAVLGNTGFVLRDHSTSTYKTTINAFYAGAWSLLNQIRDECDVRIDAHYEFDGAGVTGKVVTISDKGGVFRGRLFENGAGATDVEIMRSGSPRPMIYALGATDENDEQLTIADVEWSTAKGDPVDKPRGQAWIGVPEAVDAYPGKGQIYELAGCKDENQLIDLAWREAQRAAQPEIRVSAKLSDMEMTSGQSYKAVRMYDLAAVVTKRGEVIEKTIIAIDRNYVREWETRMTLGEEGEHAPDIARDIAKIKTATVKAARSGGGAGAKAEKNYLMLKVQEARIEGITTEISTVFVELDAVNTTLLAKAEKKELEATNTKVNEAFLLLDGDTAEGGSMVGLVSRVTQAETDIDGNYASIKSLSEAYATFETTTEKAIATIGVKVNDNEASISATADALGSRIDLKADKTYVNKLVADEIDAAFADMNLTDIETAVANYLTVKTKATIEKLALGGYNISLKSHSRITGGSIKSGYNASYTVYGNDGSAIGKVSIPTNYTFSPKYASEDVEYLAW